MHVQPGARLAYFIFVLCSVINGVLEMEGFKLTLGFSSNSSEVECNQGDEGTILVHMDVLYYIHHKY